MRCRRPVVCRSIAATWPWICSHCQPTRSTAPRASGHSSFVVARDGSVWPPRSKGGGHEAHLRSGTLPVPLVIGFGTACRLAREALESESNRLSGLAGILVEGIRSRLPGVRINGHATDRLPGNVHLGFEGVDGDALLAGLRRIAVSSGSACTTANPEPSHVLAAMGVPEALSRASLRFGLGRFNTEEDIAVAVEEVVTTVERLRGGDNSPRPTVR